MQRTCSVQRSVIAFVAACVVAGIAAPALRSQFTYEAYLEPPDGYILQGMGQWEEDNEDYLAALATYGSPPYPGHAMMIANIPPTENSNDRPFDATAKGIFLAAMEALDGEGGIPQISLSYNDHTPAGGSGFSAKTTHDDEVFAGMGSNAAMEAQITRLGEAIAEFDKPVFMRIGFEFNNVTMAGVSEGYHAFAFVDCYQRTVALFEAAGATKIAYVWCWEASAPTDYMDESGGDFKWYPGDEYVDWFGVDIFNRNEFTTLSSPITMAGSQLADVEDFLEVAEEKQVPVFIGESACVDFPIAESATDDNDSWDEWFVHYFDFIEAHPSIKAFNYISHDWTGGSGGPDNWLDSRLFNCDEVMDNWVDELSEPQYLGAGSGPLLNGYLGWWGLSNDLAGAGGSPQMVGSGTVLPSASMQVILSGAMASKPAALFVGASAIYSSFKGGVLVPAPDVLVPITTNGSGGYTFSFTWPSVATPGDTFWFHYWIKEQNSPEVWAASNAIKGVTL